MPGTVVQSGYRIGFFGAGSLLGGAHVHPHDGWAEFLTLVVHGNHGEGSGIVGDSSNVRRRNTGFLNSSVARSLECGPPFAGALLGPSGTLMGRPVRSSGIGERTPVNIEDAHPARLGTIVNAK